MSRARSIFFIPAKFSLCHEGLLFVLIFMSMVGCSLRSPERSREVFGFAPEVPQHPAPKSAPVLAVRLIEAASEFENQWFVYRTGEFEWKSDFYRVFANSPASQVTDLTRRWLSGSGIFSAVSIPGLSPRESWQLEGFLEELYGDFRNPSKPEAVLTLEYALYAPRVTASSNPLFNKKYTARKPVTELTGAGLMRAWDAALADILGRLTRDLASINWTSVDEKSKVLAKY
jgi:hypothetical protein